MNARLLLLVLPLALTACPKDDSEPDDTEADDTSTDDTGTGDGCFAVAFTDGDSGVYTVNSAADDHVKKHFDMPENVGSVTVTATWDTDWNMMAKIGTGECPHAGTVYADDYNATGTVTLTVTAGEVVEGATTFTAGQKWFAHLEIYELADPPADGSTANYTFAAEACPPPAE